MTDLNSEYWTFGAEHEWGDWLRREGLPEGFSVDEDDYTVMNSDGTACDPRGRDNLYGGEINVPPVETPRQLATQMVWLQGWLVGPPGPPTINHRSNLHVHIRVPGLSGDLPRLKQLASYNTRYLREALELVEPIPRPTALEYPVPEELRGAMRRYKRRRVSHHTVLVPARLERQLAATTVREFHEAEVPRAKESGLPMWHAQPRAAVNVRQLLETDTIEFRHFPGTLNAKHLEACASWCMDYLLDALAQPVPRGPAWLWNHGYCDDEFPTFPPYVHELEVRYRATCFDGSIPRALAAENVKKIQAGTWVPSLEDKKRAL